MSRRVWIALFAAIVVAAPLRAQLVVIDPANLTQTILIAERTLAAATTSSGASSKSFSGWRRGSGLWTAIASRRSAITGHDPSRWDYGRPWIQALNSGDARGTAYLRNGAPAAASAPGRSESLACGGRRMFERQYATMEITDSVAMMGGTPGRTGSRLLTASSRTPRRHSRTIVVSTHSRLPRNDRRPRQDRGRRTARPPPGHGRQSAAVARARAAARTQQAASRHRGRQRSTCSW